jgi:hypothetical protein
MFYMACLILCIWLYVYVFHLETTNGLFFSFCIPCLILCHVLYFSILYDMGCWHPIGLGTNGLLCSVGKQKTAKKHHNLIPSPATLSHTRSEHSFPSCAPLMSKTGAAPLDPAGIRCVVPPNHYPRSVYRPILSVYRSCGPVSRAAQVPGRGVIYQPPIR